MRKAEVTRIKEILQAGQNPKHKNPVKFEYEECPYVRTPRQRPSMISAKYRQKEERRKVLKISVNKLRKIEDPEASLCRSVLINNTMKRLQKEAKDEKCAGQQQLQHQQQPVVKQPILVNTVTDFAIDTDDLVPTELTYGSRKRPAEPEVEDCDVQDVLSQFYMPPTPRMLTSIDDDDDETLTEAKRPRFDDRTLTSSSSSDDQLQQQQLRQTSLSTPPPTAPVTTASSFSCGHASMFGELQSNVFHSLVASLET
ncbi:uncharacterized protein CBL_10661 [Carabus blaptoides fortunei]